MKNKVGKFLYWTPRILSILFILFLALFSLDVISPELGFWQIAAGLLIHNLPAIVLLIVTMVAWRHEWVGGVVFILAGLGYSAMVLSGEVPWYTALSWSLIIAGPAVLLGILFLAGWSLKRKPRTQ